MAITMRGRVSSSVPNYYSPGGMGILPRPTCGTTTTGLTSYYGARVEAEQAPLRLLAKLARIYPPLARADEIEMGLLIPPGGIRIRAVSETADGDEVEDPDGTAALDALWDTCPAPRPGLDGLALKLLWQLNYTGIPCLECVPGPSGAGVARIYVVAGSTVAFGQKSKDAPVTAYQRHDSGPDFYVELPADRVFYDVWQGSDDDPYGVPRRFAVFNEVLHNLTLRQYQRDVLKHLAWPQRIISIKAMALWQEATEVHHMTAEQASAYVGEQITAFQDMLAGANPDDDVYIPADVSVATNEGGKGLGNMEGLLTRFERSEAQGLLTLPGFMGINDSTTETTIRTQLDIQGRTLTLPRAIVVSLILKAADLHLRLLGLNLKAVADLPEIFSDDEYVAAQTEEIRTRTLGEQGRMGLRDGASVAEDLTGSGLADEERWNRWLETGGQAAAASEGQTRDARIKARRERRQAQPAKGEEEETE